MLSSHGALLLCECVNLRVQVLGRMRPRPTEGSLSQQMPWGLQAHRFRYPGPPAGLCWSPGGCFPGLLWKPLPWPHRSLLQMLQNTGLGMMEPHRGWAGVGRRPILNEDRASQLAWRAPHGLGQRGWTGALNPVYRIYIYTEYIYSTQCSEQRRVSANPGLQPGGFQCSTCDYYPPGWTVFSLPFFSLSGCISWSTCHNIQC